MPHVIRIESLDDPRLAGFRDVRDRDLRGRDGLFVVESARCVERLLRSRFEPQALLLTPRRAETMAAPLAALPETIPVFVAAEPLLNAISGYRFHGGALALARRPRHRELVAAALLARLPAPPAPCILVVGNAITDMDNIGSIFRSAAGLGAAGVLLDERCCDPLLRKPIRVAMGHSLTLPFACAEDLGAALDDLRREQGFMVVGAESSAHPEARERVVPLDRLECGPRVALLLGNEGHGLDPGLLDRCDRLVEIPMREGVPSLNVAVAAAVILWALGAGREERQAAGGRRE